MNSVLPFFAILQSNKYLFPCPHFSMSLFPHVPCVPMSSCSNVPASLCPMSSCPLCSHVLMFQCPRVLMSHVLKSPCILCSHVLMSLCPHVPMSSCSQVPISTSPIIHHFRKLPIGYNSNPRKFGIQRMLFSVRHHQSVAAASTTFSLRQNASVCVDRASRQPKAMWNTKLGAYFFSHSVYYTTKVSGKSTSTK